MIQNQYYYLVTGLPELVFDADNRKVDLLSIKNELKANVTGDDIALLDSLFLHYDNSNFLSFLKKRGQFSDLGTVPATVYEDLSESKGLLPAYMQDVLNNLDKEKDGSADEEAKHSLEVDLLTRYYEFVARYDNEFLKRWFKFDRSIRNVLAAISARKLEKEIAPFLVGSDEVTEGLTKSLSADFGLRGELPFMDKLLQAVETDSILDREKKIDLLRWEFVEEANIFSYFNIDRILGFWIKAEIIDRWIKLDPVTGEELLRKYFAEMKGDFNVNASFEENTEK